MRHAQYRLELADAVHTVAGRPVALERADPADALPAITVQWSGTTLSRRDGWAHDYDIEIKIGERGPDLDVLVAAIAETVAAWKPNTSAVSASAPTVRPVLVIDGDVNYPAVLVSTTVTEPRN